MFQNKKSDNNRKNFLGFTEETMKGTSRRSKKMVGLALVFLVLTLLLFSIPLRVDWLLAAELLGGVAIGIVIVKVISSVIASVIEAFGKRLNKFNLFATVFLSISFLGFVANLLSQDEYTINYLLYDVWGSLVHNLMFVGGSIFLAHLIVKKNASKNLNKQVIYLITATLSVIFFFILKSLEI